MSEAVPALWERSPHERGAPRRVAQEPRARREGHKNGRDRGPTCAADSKREVEAGKTIGRAEMAAYTEGCEVEWQRVRQLELGYGSTEVGSLAVKC